MANIQRTRDYGIFKKLEINRDINSSNLNKIISSIKSHNMLAFRPIVVNENMQVVDGQHRLEAAMALGVEIFYQIMEQQSEEDVILLNANQKKWEFIDYINFYIAKGNEDFLLLKDFLQRNKLSLKHLEIFDTSARSGRFNERIRKGTWKIPSENFFHDIEKNIEKKRIILNEMERYQFHDKSIFKSQKMNKALSLFISNPDVDIDLFLKKIPIKSSCISKKSDLLSYYCMFRDIYNWKNSNPIE